MPKIYKVQILAIDDDVVVVFWKVRQLETFRFDLALGASLKSILNPLR